jgi:hypothetical protein
LLCSSSTLSGNNAVEKSYIRIKDVLPKYLKEFGGLGSYTLTVTDLTPGPVTVPEPATGAMLFGGLGLMYALRKRRYGN